MLNKKIKNATRVEIDGIKFRSKLEAYTYKKLKEAKIDVEYEKYTYELLPSFTFGDHKNRAITYKPDFVGNNFVIECKGYANDVFPIKKKLFEYFILNSLFNWKYFIVKNHKEVDQLIETLKN